MEPRTHQAMKKMLKKSNKKIKLNIMSAPFIVSMYTFTAATQQQIDDLFTL